MCQRERDPSGCRASGVTPEIPAQVVLVPPLLVPTTSPSALVTKKLWILLVTATALSSRRFFSRFLFVLHPRRHTGVDIYPTDTSQ